MIDFSNIPLPIWVMIGLGVVYPVIARALLRITHPKRLKIEKLGRSLLADGKLSPLQRRHVEFSLAMNGSPWPMVALVLVAPFVLLGLAFVPPWRNETDRDRELLDLAKDRRYAEIMDMELVCFSAANPVVALIFAVELSLLFIPAVALLASRRGFDLLKLRLGEALEQVATTTVLRRPA